MCELEWVRQVQQGDNNAFSSLVQLHQKGVFRIALRFVKDFDMAEDVTQDTFIKAYQNIRSFEGRSQFRSWLYQIAINTAKNKLRERRDHLDIDDVTIAVIPQTLKNLASQNTATHLRRLVDGLPPKQRLALILRIYEDLSFKEIAEVMDCPYDTAKANFRHGLFKLKQLLKPEQEEELCI